jgi:hypothetical protein
MNSHPTSKGNARLPLLVAEGGVEYRLSGSADPFAAWMNLMETVEALCPRWPQRERSVGGTYRL